MTAAAILDVDGTLVDTNYHHCGDEVEHEKGEDIRAAEKALYMALIEEVDRATWTPPSPNRAS